MSVDSENEAILNTAKEINTIKPFWWWLLSTCVNWMMSSEQSRRSTKSYSGIKLPVEEGDFGSLDL